MLREEEYYRKTEALHKDPVLKAEFHSIIAKTTLWRYCVFCGEKIDRGGESKNE